MDWKKIRDAVMRTIKRLPGIALILLRTKTGLHLVTAAVVAALKAVGVNAPFDVVSEALRMLGANVDPATVFDALMTGILTSGTLFANDGVQQVRAAMRAKYPDTPSVNVDAAREVFAPRYMRERFFPTAKRILDVVRYERIPEGVRAVAATGETLDIPYSTLRRTEEFTLWGLLHQGEAPEPTNTLRPLDSYPGEPTQ